MPNYIIYNPDDERVPNRVTQYLTSKDPGDVAQFQNKIEQPTQFPNCNQLYWKVESGDTIIEMNAEEKIEMDKQYFMNDYARRERMEVINDIFNSCTSQEQFLRIRSAFRKFPDFMLNLDDYSYNMARGVVDEALADELINQDDADMVKSKLPLQPE